MDIIAPLCVAAFDEGWITLSFARPYDLSVGSLGDRLRDVKPTIFLGVPRVWEKVQEKMVAAGANAPASRAKLIRWVRGVVVCCFRCSSTEVAFGQLLISVGVFIRLKTKGLFMHERPNLAEAELSLAATALPTSSSRK